jgi:hypothetical protein
MAKTSESNYKPREKVRFIPNYGLVYTLDRGLRKQLDDLNEMKGLPAANQLQAYRVNIHRPSLR